jgi:hypothetical protein
VGEFASRRVGGEGLVAQSVALVEQRQLGAGMGLLRCTMTRVPAGQPAAVRRPGSR